MEKSLNPALITTTASLMQMLDKKVLILLRDGKSYVGILITVDSYGTCVLENSVERIYVEDKFGDVECGVILLRGENIAFIGEYDHDKTIQSYLTHVSLEKIMELHKNESSTLIAQRNRWKKLGIEVEKSVFNWFTPFAFPEEDSLL